MRRVALALVVALAPWVARADVWGPTTVNASTDDTFQSGSTVVTNGTTIGGSLDATTEWVFMRFTGVTIPQGATINSATLEVVPSASTEDEPNVTIYLEDADNCATGTNGTNNITNRTRTTNTVAWSSNNLGANGSTYYAAPDLAVPMQDVINRPGWSSGSALCVIIQGGSSSTRDLTIEAYDLGPGTNPPRLTIDYQTAQTYNDPITETTTPAVALADVATFSNALAEAGTAADSLSDELVPAGGGTPTLVQQNAAAPATNGTGTYAVSFPGATTAGSLLLVVVSGSDGLSTSWTVTDTASNVYRSNTTAQITNGSNLVLKAYWVENAASVTSVTVDGANWESLQISISEWSGMMTSGDPFDVGATGGGYNVLTTGSTGTTTQASALLVGPIYRLDAATDFTEGTGFTKVHEADSPTLALQYKVLSSTGTVTSEWASASSSGTNQLLAIVFKAGSGGGPATYNDSISESASGTDALSTAATMASSASEAATASDALAAANLLAALVGEASGAGDSLSTSATWSGASSETAAASDTLASAATFSESVTDAATAADALVDVHIPGGGGPQVYNDTASEAAAAADAFATVATWESAVSEAGAAGETLATSATFPGVVSEVATSSESFAAAATFPNAQNEASVATDELVAAAVYVESLTETVSAADAQSAAGSVWADALTEAVSSSAAFVDSIPASLQEQLDACRARVKVLERQLRGYLPFP